MPAVTSAGVNDSQGRPAPVTGSAAVCRFLISDGSSGCCGIIACREASLASNSADRFLMSESCLKVFFCSGPAARIPELKTAATMI